MQKKAYMGIDTVDSTGSGLTEAILVDARKVHSARERAVKLRKNAVTYVFGALIKQVLENLDLWEAGK
ncbi:hypothetical protein NQ534_01940 [Marvinbryantia formatexigens DSM 14469]|nr:hypothetical protein [Marvinbryantia formatexigens]UWO25278.1 hypothetical protein NQ534_01940 [Marvinbryantia formatexigens DSM 14469]SDH03196.1 hypothetical protein SAMN05660368_03710 [Marvinbryantia formatexigens]